MTNATQGRRPDGPGWYWYTGTFGGHHPADEPVRVFDWNEPDEETSGLWAAGTLMGEYPIEKLPGDFLPLTKPVAAPQPLWDDAPEWARWWAVDSWGIRIWFQREPRTDMGKWREPLDGQSLLEYDGPGEELPIGCDWRTTLRRRPEVQGDK